MDGTRVYVAGAAGAIGLPLVKMLVSAGYSVIGTTRRADRAATLRQIGVTPELVDVYDRESLALSLRKHRPEVVIHQLTDLPYGLPKEQMEEGRRRNEQIRLVGTRNLIDGLAGLPARRLIVQSIAFMYAPGPQPHPESDALGSPGLVEFERLALDSGYGPIILRYGRFYGEGTGVDGVDAPCRVHVTAAAQAAVLALQPLRERVYNVCEDAEYADNRSFISETGWNPRPWPQA